MRVADEAPFSLFFFLLLADQQWELAFQVHEEQSSEAVQEQQRPAARADDPDELARAAASLIDAVRHEQNPKFQNSAFLGLMKQLRDREVVIEGNQMVPTEEATTTGWAADFQAAADIKGKGRAVELPGRLRSRWVCSLPSAGRPPSAWWHPRTADQRCAGGTVDARCGGD